MKKKQFHVLFSCILLLRYIKKTTNFFCFYLIFIFAAKKCGIKACHYYLHRILFAEVILLMNNSFGHSVHWLCWLSIRLASFSIIVHWLPLTSHINLWWSIIFNSIIEFHFVSRKKNNFVVAPIWTLFLLRWQSLNRRLYPSRNTSSQVGSRK